MHRDSLGTEQSIRPGQLNLMSAGGGVVHSEESESYRGPVHGVQLWVAQPDATRHGAPQFEHHGDLPRLQLGAAEVTVLLGEIAGCTSAGRTDTPLVGVDIVARRGRSVLPLRTDFEYALVVLDGSVVLDEQVVHPGTLAYLGNCREELALTSHDETRMLLIGGVPFDEPVLMWWNFVARNREEIRAAYSQWRAGQDRFPDIASPLPRIPAPQPSWLTEP